jgi:hypothetical protein
MRVKGTRFPRTEAGASRFVFFGGGGQGGGVRAVQPHPSTVLPAPYYGAGHLHLGAGREAALRYVSIDMPCQMPVPASSIPYLQLVCDFMPPGAMRCYDRLLAHGVAVRAG